MLVARERLETGLSTKRTAPWIASCAELYDYCMSHSRLGIFSKQSSTQGPACCLWIYCKIFSHNKRSSCMPEIYRYSAAIILSPPFIRDARQSDACHFATKGPMQ